MRRGPPALAVVKARIDRTAHTSELGLGRQLERMRLHVRESALKLANGRVDCLVHSMHGVVEPLCGADRVHERVLADEPAVGMPHDAKRVVALVRVVAVLQECSRREVPRRARLKAARAAVGAVPTGPVSAVSTPLQAVTAGDELHGRASGLGDVDELQLVHAGAYLQGVESGTPSARFRLLAPLFLAFPYPLFVLLAPLVNCFPCLRSPLPALGKHLRLCTGLHQHAARG
mmetsp:Transcript_49651/g.119580  ORF Transcript_49651/g.119580 Transcript_49651/m.119580 type:complete len:231 (+) Transcript_49651:457-1149(+)